MTTLTKKQQIRILENNFNIYKDGNNWDLEAWTNGGVNMFININIKNDIILELTNYAINFDIDEEIDIYRQGADYKRAFTITESVKDFENWIDWVNSIIKQLSGQSEEKPETLTNKIDKLIIEEFGEYSPSDLNDIIIDLIQNHEFYKIQSYYYDYLINDIEKLKEAN